MKKFKGYSLVFSQFLLILIILLPLGTPTQNLLLGVGVIVMGLGVAILALYENRLGNFNIRPDIKEDATLVKSGIYAYIRHPMYTSVLIMMFGVVLLYPVRFVVVSYLLLVIILLLKLLYEESLWKAESSEYVEYMQQTKRLIPYVF